MGVVSQVVLLGKPAPAIYKVAMEMLSAEDPQHVLAIGDSMEHDIAGKPPGSVSKSTSGLQCQRRRASHTARLS